MQKAVHLTLSVSDRGSTGGEVLTAGAHCLWVGLMLSCRWPGPRHLVSAGAKSRWLERKVVAGRQLPRAGSDKEGLYSPGFPPPPIPLPLSLA